MSPFALIALPFLVAFAFVALAGKPFIAYLRSKKSVQPISPDAPEKHRLKHGTPTMGGFLIIGGVIVSLVSLGLAGIARGDGAVYTSAQWMRVWDALLVFCFAGLIGVLDDLGKARKKENKAGLSERAKLALQVAVAVAFVAVLYAIDHTSTATTLRVGSVAVDLGAFYWIVATLLLIGFANAVNFTDGLDGLAGGVTLIAALTLGIATLSSGVLQPTYSGLAVFYGAVAGACAGFLCFNAYPARVFMGDTGSLALGMGLTGAAIAAKQELLLLIVGAVYLAEIASMMIQRYVFKYRRIKFGIEHARANRVFRRAPLHHHFEELGMYETQVVMRFCMAGLVAAAVGLLVSPFLVPRPAQFAEPVLAQGQMMDEVTRKSAEGTAEAAERAGQVVKASEDADKAKENQ